MSIVATRIAALIHADEQADPAPSRAHAPE
jgi:hypothetical protein